jgi:RNA polymerase sigma-70 factor (ECF subfamily)
VYNEDRKLVGRMLAGDSRAFNAFFELYARRLAAFAARRTSFPADRIEDLVQGTLIKAIRNLAGFRGEAALFTWLCEICRHELINMQRSAARQPELEDIDVLAEAEETLLELRAAEETDPLHMLEKASHRSTVAATLNGLPERYARALEWKYGDGFSVDEIARMLGLTTIAAQSLLARARQAFKQSWPEGQSS